MQAVEIDAIRSAAGLDASRRVGWAKYFDANDEIAQLNADVRDAVGQAVAFALMIQHHNRLRYDDPLVVFAYEFLTEVGSTPEGHQLIEATRGRVL
jgi:hypothetical protein